MTYLLTQDARIKTDTRSGEIVLDPIARITMTCCGATLATVPNRAVFLGRLLDACHECVPCDGR